MQSLESTLQAALRVLSRAARYAADTGRERWDFAVELQSLVELGVNFCDLRWLLCKGYVRHAVETTLPGDTAREFRTASPLLFPPASCFIITDAGIALVREIESAVSGAPVGMQIPPGLTNGSANHVPGLIPTWDRYRQELRVGDVVVKQFKVPAPNQELVLAAFQEEGWPVHIDDPLPPRGEQDTKRRLHETITSLNRNQRARLVRFMGDGTGQGIRWELIIALGTACAPQEFHC